MNENNETSNGILNDINISDGDGSTIFTDGSGEQTSNSDTDGSASSPNVWTNGNDANSSLYGNGDSTDFYTIYTEILQQETLQTEQLTSINGWLVLVFMFLILSWTEKKINVAVNRFTDKRR